MNNINNNINPAQPRNNQIGGAMNMSPPSRKSKKKYYMWLSRFFMFIAFISLLLTIFSSLAILKLAPSIRIDPFLITNQSDTKEIVRVEPITRNMASIDQLKEMFIKYYIITRNTIINDQVEMRSRWFPGGIVHFLSSYDVFQDFEANIQLNIINAQRLGLTREVEIISVKRLGARKSAVYKVDFKTYDLVKNPSQTEAKKEQKTITTRYWTASITSYFRPYRYFMARRLLNPIGFTVERYSQTEVDVFS